MSALTLFPALPEHRFDEAAFLTFVDSLDTDRRWELIDGIPIEMPPATICHVRIAANLERCLNGALAAAGLRNLEALREIALRHPTDREFRPVADVSIVDPAEITDGPDDRFFDRCFLAAEVLSPSTAHYDLVWKLPRYREWPDCSYALLLSQAEVAGRLWSRATGWTERKLGAADALVLPEFGFTRPLADIYEGTGLP